MVFIIFKVSLTDKTLVLIEENRITSQTKTCDSLRFKLMIVKDGNGE